MSSSCASASPQSVRRTWIVRLNEAADSAEKIKQKWRSLSCPVDPDDIVCEAGLDVR